MKVCPTGASFQREDGIIAIDSDKCSGCGYCLVSCPYQQRTPCPSGSEGYFPGQKLTEFEKIGRELHAFKEGTVVKCTFCEDRIDEGLARGLSPGLDREATPACVNNCPVKARWFGDLNEPSGKVSILIRQRKGFQLHPELGTDPSVYYID